MPKYDLASQNPNNSAPEALEISDVDYRQKPDRKKILRYAAVGVVVFLLLCAVIGVIVWAAVQESDETATTSVATTESSTVTTTLSAIAAERLKRRIDCYPEAEGGVDQVNQNKCERRGCTWDDYNGSDNGFDTPPQCYVPQPDEDGSDGAGFGYRVTEELPTARAGETRRWKLQRINDFAIYGNNIENLTFEVEYVSSTLLRFKFDDADDDTRYKVPVPLNKTEDSEERLYRVEVTTNGTFAFKIIRASTSTVLWDTSVGGFTFTDQFLQISTQLPSHNIYGFGENLHWSLKHDMNYRTWPLFSRDQASASDEMDWRAKNLYSVHPYYECLENDGNAHGVLLLNSNAMDYTMSPLPMLTYKTIGGILDFYMFLGPEPEAVVQQYTQLVGRPYMPPYWMLGFQLCRYGYTDTEDMKAAVNRTLYYDIPYDVQYADIDHMYKQRDFTIDEEAFGDLPEYFEELRNMGLRTIIILDPALEINDTYTPYVEGLEGDIFIKWPSIESMPDGDYEEYNNTNMMGYVWPEWKVVFPDFFKDKTAELWTKWIVDFIDELPFDALWVDMNEPANFGTNEERPWNWPVNATPYWSLKCPNNTWDDPPYRTKAAYTYDNKDTGLLERISSKTLCMIGVQGNNSEYRHYDVHSLYGWKQAQVSLESMRAAIKHKTGEDRRSMVLTRSSYPGTGSHAGRWLGDNKSDWPDVALSVIGMLEFNLMGMPYIGADICGFFENATSELCMRWQELGAFYPFARNHNTKGATHQDPGYFGADIANRARDTLLIRYKLLPYLYTLFYTAHTEGNSVVRPLFHEFPTDANTWSVDRQFLWGPALLITPIMEQGASSLTYYMPSGRWYNWYTHIGVNHESENVTIDVNYTTPIQIHIRGGYILPWQEPANNTYYSRQNAFGLLAALDSVDGKASGQLFWDDGDSIDTYESGNYYLAEYKIEMSHLNISVVHNGIDSEMRDLYLNTVHILGVQNTTMVMVEGTEHSNFTYDTDTQDLLIEDLHLQMNTSYYITWS